MGFFSKVWKGIKKGVKKIGKGIKKAVKSVGKFMDKIGIVGQIGLAIILPGIGSAIAGWAAGAAGAGGIIGGVAKVVSTAAKFIQTGMNAFKTVTDGIFGFVGEMGKTFANKIAGKMGFDPIFSSAGSNMTEAFQGWMRGVGDDVRNITSPFRDAANASTEAIDAAFNKSTDLPFDEDELLAPDLGKDIMDPDFVANANTALDLEDPLSAATDILTGDPVRDNINIRENIVGSVGGQDVGPDPFMLSDASTEVAQQVKDQLQKEQRGYVGQVVDYAKNAVAEFPKAVVDTTVGSITRGIGQAAINAITGGPPTPEYTEVYNQIPSFDFGASEQLYNQYGYQYGTPQQGIQFFAANQGGYGSFGRNAYNTYSQFRTA